MSNVTYVKLKAQSLIAIVVPNTNAFLLKSFIRINDVFDWLGTGNNLKAQGAAQWFTLYEKCLVTGSKISVKFRVNDANASDNTIRNC